MNSYDATKMKSVFISQIVKCRMSDGKNPNSGELENTARWRFDCRAHAESQGVFRAEHLQVKSGDGFHIQNDYLGYGFVHFGKFTWFP